jgi:hypothetical protein
MYADALHNIRWMGLAFQASITLLHYMDIYRAFTGHPPSLLQVNLVGAVRVTQAFLPLLRQGQQPGRIINMSSQVGHHDGGPCWMCHLLICLACHAGEPRARRSTAG